MTGEANVWGERDDRGRRRACILIAEPEPGERRPGGPSLAFALASLADPADDLAPAIESVTTWSACIDRCRRGPVDLVVIDEALGREAEEIVARLRRGAPELIVLQRGTGDGAALAWFRRGASECVAADRDLAALRHAARERLERARARRPGGAEDLPDARGILQHLGSALVIVDEEGAIAFANPAAERTLGLSREALHGRRFRDLLIEATEPASLGGEAASAHGLESRAGEARVLRPDGHAVPIALTWGPIVGANGAPTGAVAVFQDVSLTQEWRSHALQTEKMASIGQLAAGVAHEINNPMGFIHANLFQMTEYVTDLRQVWSRVEGLLKAIGGDRSLVERAAGELAGAVEEADVGFLLQDLAKAIRESQEGSERIRHIVQDLRDFSHQDTGERVLADINQCLDSTANIVWPMMKHLVVLSKNYGELPPVPCYPMQLKQVFMNLLVNAYQAIEESSARDGRIGTVTLATVAIEDGVRVEISDTGAGIAREHLDRIFDPFFTTKKVGAGTGLGLSTSFNIVRRHGGTLSVDSEPGRGTTFCLQLPLLREEIGSRSA